MGKTTATDRLIFTLLFSIIVHTAIVLGVTFDASSPPTNQPLVNIEITLVKQQTELAPEKADFLAQANNEGGGETDTKSPDPTPDAPVPVEDRATTVTTKDPSAPPPKPVQPEPAPEPIKTTEKPLAKPDKVVLTQAKADRKIDQSIDPEDKSPAQTDAAPPTPQVSARDLKLPSQDEIALLEQQFNASSKALSKWPKKRRISAATKEYGAAAYMEAWRLKVQRIGNFNYPQEAKRLGLNGSLMLSVDINPDGSVPSDGIVISRSSGHKTLDNAAVRIVRLGAPYAAISEDVLQGSDMLTIIRTWKFETNSLSTR